MSDVQQKVKVDIEAAVRGMKDVVNLRDALKEVKGAGTGGAGTRAARDLDGLSSSGGRALGVLRFLSPAADNAAGSFERGADAVGLKNKALLGLAAGGGAAIGVIGAVGAGVFRLAQVSAEAGAGLSDLSDKTGFAVEDLSAFRLATEKSGTDINQFGDFLIKFQINLADAAKGNKELREEFKRLGVDISADPRVALEQFFRGLSQVTDEAERLEVASKLGGRGAKELGGAFREIGPDLDAFVEKARRMGFVIDEEMAKAADAFDDTYSVLKVVVAGSIQQLGGELLPEVTGVMGDINGSLQGNQQAFREWGREIANVVGGIRSLVKSELGGTLVELAKFAFWLSPVGGTLNSIGLAGETQRNLDNQIVGTKRFRSMQSIPLADEGGGRRRTVAAPGGGRGGGGRSPAEDGRKLLKDLEIELANVGFTSRLAALNATLLDDRYAKLSTTIKDKARALAAQIDELKESNQEQKDAAQIVERYNNALRQMSDELFPRSEMDRLNEQLADPKVNAALSDRVKLLLRMLALTKDMRAVDPLAGAGASGPLGPAGVEDWAKQRSAESDIGWFVPTPDEVEQNGELQEKERLRRRREEMRAFLSDLSQDITSAIGGSLDDIFQGKVTDFLKGFGQGLLDIGKRFLLQMVESGLFELLKMLTGLGGGGGGGAKKGGGLFGKIFGFASMALSFIPGGNIASGLLGGLLGGGGVGAGQSAAGKVTGNFGGGFADGGVIDGPTDRTDALTARVTRGEGVLNLRAMARYGGRRLVDSLNSLSLPPDFAFAGGPLVAGQITPSVGGGAELRELARSRGQGGAWGGMTGGIMERLAAALENFEAMPPDHVVMKSMSSTGVQRAVGDAFMSHGARDPRTIEWMQRRVANL